MIQDPKNPLLRRLRHVILDLDGTLYLDEQLFDDTLPFLAALRDRNIGHTFITNNNSRSRAEYVRLLQSLGLEASATTLFTSAHATFDYLRQNVPEVSRPFVLGTPGLLEDFRLAGFQPSDAAPDAVVVGFDRTLTYERLSQAAYWIQQGLPYVATHPDRVCPTREAIVLPDCGALVSLLESATGRQPDAIPGKPSPAMAQAILRQHDLQPQEVAMIGDRLYTDIKMAFSAGILSVLTLTGETQRGDLVGASVQPDVVIERLNDLTQWFTDQPQGDFS